MTADLRSQIRAYGAQLIDEQRPLTAAEVTAAARSIPTTLPAAKPGDRRPYGVVIAAGAAVLVLLALAPLALLRGGSAPEVPSTVPTADQPSTPSLTSSDTAPAQTAPGLETIPGSIVAEVVTPSSIGDAVWTVYESETADAFDGFLVAESFTNGVDRSVLDSLMSVDGIATDVFGSALGSVGQGTLTSWFVDVNWTETALLHGGADLADRSNDGAFLAEATMEAGIWEVALFAGDPRTGQHGEIEGDPIETIARYEWTSVPAGEGWLLRVVDLLTGEAVGSITSPFPVVPEGYEPILTVSEDGAAEVVRPPEWFDADREFETFHLDIDDSTFAYVKEGEHSSLADWVVWRSTDGTNWENLGRPRGFPFGYVPLNIVGDDGFYVAHLDDNTDQNEPGPDFLTVSTHNGVDWEPADDLPPTQGSVHRVPAGWVWAAPPGDTPVVSMWTSPDGESWDRIDTAEVPGRFFGIGGGTGWRSSGSTLVAAAFRDEPPQTRLWVVQFP